MEGREGDSGSDDELLQQWEVRIAGVGDPLAALAELLGERQAARRRLFALAGAEVLGCRLDRILGAGGMGVTYAGTTADGDAVAVKLVPRVAGAARERFAQECRVLRGLSHPAIVRHRADAVTDEQVGVLVMDLVDGLDLDQLLGELRRDAPADLLHPVAQELLREVDAEGDDRLRSPRVRRRLLRLLAEVAEGLHEAHERGVVHRDVKPANVLVRPDLSPVVVDFGLARDGLNRVSFTQSGIAMGTLAYMAPEQLLRDPGAVDRRADVHALGLVLFRALCGVDLREHVDDVVRAGRRPFLLSARQSRMLPVEVQAILYRCLEPRPERRYATAAALAQDLRAAAGQGTVLARRPSALGRFLRDRRRANAALAVAATVVAAACWWSWPQGRLVRFAANCHPDDAWVEVDGRHRVAIGGTEWLPLGAHVARLVSADAGRLLEVVGSFELAPGAATEWVNLLTLDTKLAEAPVWFPGRPAIQLMTGHTLTQPAPGVARDRRDIDGRELAKADSPFAENLPVEPGIRRFGARDGRGRTEQQDLVLGAGPVDVQLLPRVLADVDGAFRRTWSTVLSPRPPDLDLRAVRGQHVVWMGRSGASSLGGLGAEQAPCAVTPAAGGEEVVVELVCRFPGPMRSAVVHLRGATRQGGALTVRAGFDGEPLEPWPQVDGRLAERRAFAAVAPRTAFRVEARMRAASDPADSAAVRFLDGVVFGGHYSDEPPCFAIAADPADAAQIPRTTPATLAELPRRGQAHVVAADLAVPGGLLRVVAPLPGPGGEVDLIVTEAVPDGSPVVRRLGWPTLREKGRIVAGQLHARTTAGDGAAFGTRLASVPGLGADGWSALVVGDVSSNLRGAANGGAVGLFDWRGAGATWCWPPRSLASRAALGDDSYEDVHACGDWSGDGVPDVAVAAWRAWTEAGSAQAGAIEVLDARSGGLLWRRFGEATRSALRVLDAWDGSGAAPAALLLCAAHDLPALGAPSFRSWSLWRGGLTGSATDGLVTDGGATAVLVGPVGGGEPALVVLEGHAAGRSAPRLGRYVERDGALELTDEQALPPLAFARGIAASRTDDLDGDGVLDAAFVVVGPSSPPGALFVSGGTGAALAFVAHAAEPSGSCAWMPASGGAPGQLLVPAGRRLLGIVLE